MPAETKKPSQSKTIWVNLLAFVATSIPLVTTIVDALLQNEAVLQALLSPLAYQYALSALSALNVWLRFQTKTGLSLK